MVAQLIFHNIMELQTSHENQNESNTSSANIEFHKSNIDILDEPHRNAVTCAVSKVLSTAIAETTYAQIVNGLPLPEVVNDTYGEIFPHDHPIYQHTHLKEGTLSKLRGLREQHDPKVLRFDVSAASLGSRAFRTRLIEIIAIAVHQVAVLLYQNNPDLSAPGSALQAVHTWTPPKDDYDGTLWWRFNPDGPPATLFHHAWYRNPEQYPDGAADMAGYWAENRVLGGVVLFDREARKPCGAGLDAVYIHPDRDEVTYRICLLTDAQKKALLDFFLRDSPGAGTLGTSDEVESCPLPIVPDGTNTHRVDTEEPIWCTGVYRDRWERAMPPPLWMGDGRASCVYNPLDFPTKRDQDDANYRWGSRGDRRDD